ncbi:MAG TPA: ATP-binding protein [Terriglobales bacterium]|nr:ATP-binding protein [Terriglobales bacterium]
MRSRRAFLLFAGGGLVAHALVLALFVDKPQGPLFSDVVQFALGAGAAVAAWVAGGRSRTFARQVWHLASVALWIYTAGQGLVIYYDNIAHAQLFSPWISDQFLFFWIVPLVAAAFADRLRPGGLSDPAMVLDLFQVLMVAVALHEAVFGNPATWQANGTQMAFLEWKVKLIRDGVVLGALLLRAFSTRSQQMRGLLLRLALFFGTYMFADGVYLYAEASWQARAGVWLDLLWSVPRVVLIVVAATWTPAEETEPALAAFEAPRSRVWLHLVPILGPFLVLATVTTVVVWGPLLALGLVLGSLIISSLRLLLTQYRQEDAMGALRRSETRYRALFERNRAGVFRSSPARGIIDCNQAFVDMFGYAREELIGMPPYMLYPGGKAERDMRMAGLKQEGQLSDYEICYRHKNGSLVWAIQNVMMVRDENGQDLIEGTVVDITERHHLEEQLRQSQKMEAVGRLAGGVAHDFNNLLTVISGYSQLLEDKLRDEPGMAADTRQIREAAERAAGLTRQLLAFSRRQVLQPQSISLNTTLENIEKMLRRLIGEHIDLVTDCSADLWTVKADPGQVEQVLMNLAVNARDAMPHGGQLRFETRNCGITAEEQRQHPLMPAAEYVRLSVADSGVGMDANTQAHIFEPFFTTKDPGEGTGLGLSTVYGIVKQSGGYIWVHSEAGKGTRFDIYLPRSTGDSGATAARTATTTATQGNETVLLVEDDEGVRRFTSAVLKQYGYTVLEARNGTEAFGASQKHVGDIQLLISDVILPEMSGVIVAERLRTERPRMRVLFISGYSPDTHPWQAGAAAPREPIVQKPFMPTTLAQAVRKALDMPAAVLPR